MNESRGQMSVEVLFLFAISMIVLIAFTIPIGQMAIENTLDVADALNAQSEINKLANGIDYVCSQGAGAKRVETVESNRDLSVIIKPKSVSAQLQLHDGKTKKVSQSHNSDNSLSSLKLDKGVNRILISWNEGSENIIVKKL